jgi:RNA polymerase sigma factor (TIGR02999 family)
MQGDGSRMLQLNKMPGSQDVTRLLARWRGGDEHALVELTPLVYAELHRLARGYMKGERPSHTLQATALVNEAFLRLADADVAWQDRRHFLAIAASAMRRILVDHARERGREKRGGDATRVTLEDDVAASSAPAVELLDLDRALTRLAEVDARKAQLIELRFFGGLSYEEIATALDISTTTLVREQTLAKAWLYREIAK